MAPMPPSIADGRERKHFFSESSIILCVRILIWARNFCVSRAHVAQSERWLIAQPALFATMRNLSFGPACRKSHWTRSLGVDAFARALYSLAARTVSQVSDPFLQTDINSTPPPLFLNGPFVVGGSTKPIGGHSLRARGVYPHNPQSQSNTPVHEPLVSDRLSLIN